MVPIEGYDGKYMLDRSGQILSIKYASKPRYLKHMKNTSGYEYVTLCKNSKPQNYRIHRLLAKSFIPNPKGYDCINHIDGNKLNNSLDNLEWCTQKHNIRHAISIGLFVPFAYKNGYYDHKGENGPNSRLKELQVINIRHMRGAISSYDLAPLYGVHHKTIRDIWNRKSWRHI